MKEKFEAPKLELNIFSVEDVVTASTGGGLIDGGAGDNSDNKSYGDLFG